MKKRAGGAKRDSNPAGETLRERSRGTQPKRMSQRVGDRSRFERLARMMSAKSAFDADMFACTHVERKCGKLSVQHET